MSPRAPKHELKSRALVRARCCCGWPYRNEKLRKQGCDGRMRWKTDAELEEELEAAFKLHVDDMKDRGF